MIDISPTTSLIESMRKQGLPWHIILSELIDNSFDAGANRVSISFCGSQLEVIDDGAGCQDLSLLVKPGARKDSKTTDLGKYGIGAKDATISAGNAVSIISTKDSVRRSIQCNWKKLEESGQWLIDPAIESPTQEPNGTRIIINPLRSDRVHRPQELIETLSLRYTPGIRQGRQIIFKQSAKSPAVPVPEYQWPNLEHQSSHNFTVSGLEAKVTMGLIPEGQPVRDSGLFVMRKYRVCLKGQRNGLGDDPTPGLLGWIELLGKNWELGKNKDKVISNLGQLDNSINMAFADTIRLAAKRAQVVEFNGISDTLNGVLREMSSSGNNSKAKRRPPMNATGTIKPTGTGRPHTRAAVVQPGTRFVDPRNGNAIGSMVASSKALKVSFMSMGANGPSSKYEGNVIYLNSDIPVVKSAAGNQQAIALHAIYAIAAHLATNNCQFEFMYDADSTFEKMAAVAGYMLARLEDCGIQLAHAG